VTTVLPGVPSRNRTMIATGENLRLCRRDRSGTSPLVTAQSIRRSNSADEQQPHAAVNWCACLRSVG
jgi:hypothetical protein